MAYILFYKKCYKLKEEEGPISSEAYNALILVYNAKCFLSRTQVSLIMQAEILFANYLM